MQFPVDSSSKKSRATMNKPVEVDQMLIDHVEQTVTDEMLWHLAQDFQKEGYVLASHLIPDSLKEQVFKEVHELLRKHAIRRDAHIKQTGNSPRFMSNVSRQAIAEHGRLIPAVYHSKPMKRLLGSIAQDELYGVPWKDEEFIITRQERAGDTHGWHWGDYSYTLIWVVQAPSLEYGGMLQCVPHTIWDKDRPQVNQLLCENTISTYPHKTGDVYFLESHHTLHRTVPLTIDATRIILNTCWAGPADLKREISHETMKEAFVQTPSLEQQESAGA